MRPSYRSEILGRGLAAALLTISLLVTPAFSWQVGAAAGLAKSTAATLTTAERQTIARVRLETIRSVTTTLSSKEMEGRGTAQPGGERAAKYLADKFASYKLKPLGDNGTYLQAVGFRSYQVLPETSLKAGDSTLKHGDDFVLPPPFTYEEADVTAPLVFVGYGVTSAELKRDDLAGLDLKNKIVVMLSGRPTNVDETAWQRAAGGQAKVTNLFARGIAGLIIANAGTKSQPFSTITNYLSRRQVSLASSPVLPMKLPPTLLVSDSAIEKLFAGAGETYAQTLAKATTGESSRATWAERRRFMFESRRRRGRAATSSGCSKAPTPS